PEVPVVCLAIAALGAAIISGTANRRAEATGVLLALCARAAVVGADEIRHAPGAETWLTGIPGVLGVVGIGGGLVGRIAVPPAPRLPRFAQLGSRITPTIVGEPRARIAWGRILAGAAVVVVGTMNADAIQQALSRVLAGRSGAFGAVQLVAWELSVLMALAGGVLAGGNTRGGVRQGAIAGVLAAGGGVGGGAGTGRGASRGVESWGGQPGR